MLLIDYNLSHLTVFHYPVSQLCNFILMNLLLLSWIKTSNIGKILKFDKLAKAKVKIFSEYLAINLKKPHFSHSKQNKSKKQKTKPSKQVYALKNKKVMICMCPEFPAFCKSLKNITHVKLTLAYATWMFSEIVKQIKERWRFLRVIEFEYNNFKDI